MTDFWVIAFWLIMLTWLIGGLGWWSTTTPARINHGVLWILLAILGGYAIGFPGLPGR